jgi:predicted PurR-regulated permease PerM
MSETAAGGDRPGVLLRKKFGGTIEVASVVNFRKFQFPASPFTPMSSKEERSESSGGRAPASFDLRGDNVMRIWRFFFLFVLCVLFLLLLWKAVPVLLLLFAGALVALALRFVSDQVSRYTHIPPRWSLSLVLFVLTAGGVAVGILMAPAISEQFQELASSLQQSLASLERRLSDRDIGRYIFGWIQSLGEGDGATELWARVAGVFATTFGAVAGFSLTLIIGLFLAYNPGLYVRGFLRLIPIQKRARASEMITELGDTLRWWMVGQLISMIVLAVSTWVMLWLLGVPLAFILALLTGLLTFIPYLGPLIAAIPILLIAFVESPTLMLTVLLFYLLIQNVEANVLMPIIFQKTVHLAPVLTIIAQVLLGAIFGLVGIILATPLMAAGLTLIKMIYVEDILGDSFEKPVRPMPE